MNGLVEYFVVESQNETLTEDEKMRSADGYGTFAIAFPHQGQVNLYDHHPVDSFIAVIVVIQSISEVTKCRSLDTDSIKCRTRSNDRLVIATILQLCK